MTKKSNGIIDSIKVEIKDRIIEVPIIYYHHNIGNSTNFTIGFRCGADCDGEQKGISHFLEHMLFNGTKTMNEKQLNNFLRYNGAQQNAFTTQDTIAATSMCPSSNIETVLKTNCKMLLKKDFIEEQCDRERKVIIEELNLARDESKDIDATVGYLIKNTNTKNSADILGNEKTLANIHAKDLLDYSNKYFVLENLVISVVSSLPYNDIKDMCTKYLVSKLKSKPENKVITKKRTYNYEKIDKLLTADIPNANTFTLGFIFKGKQDVESNDIFTRFEDFYFNGLSGRFYERMRLEEPLIYSAGIKNIELPDLKLKELVINTSCRNFTKTLNATIEILNEIIYKGISQKDFILFKSTILTDREARAKVKFHNSSELYLDYIYGEDIFVHDFFKKLMSLTQDELNNYLKSTYGNSPVIISFIGDLYKAMNIPTAKEVKELKTFIKHIPLTVTNEAFVKLVDKKTQELYGKIAPIPSLEEILNKFKIRNKVYYNITKENNVKSIELANKKLIKLLNGDKNLLNNNKKVELKKEINETVNVKNDSKEQ